METYALLNIKYKDLDFLDNQWINAMLYEYYYRAILFLIVSPMRNIMENLSTLSSA